MWQYMLDKDHFYDLRDLPVGHWSTSKLQMTKNSIWMHFHEPNSTKYYNTSNPIDFKKPYTPPLRTKKVNSHSSLKLDVNSSKYVCDNNNFAITNDNLQIMNEEDAYRNPKPIIPVVGTLGKAIAPKTNLRSKTNHKSLREMASIPTTTRSVRTIRSLTSTPTNPNRNSNVKSRTQFNEIDKSRNIKPNPKIYNDDNLNQKSAEDNKDTKIYFSLNQIEGDTKAKEESFNIQTAADINDNNSDKVIFVNSSQEDREAAQAKLTQQIIERKERKYERQIPSFTVCGDKTVISNSADIDSNITTNKAVIFSDELPDPPLYIDKRYGDNGHKNPLRISQIEIRKQFKDALENGKLDDYDYDYDVDEVYNNDDDNDDDYVSRHNTVNRNQKVNVIRERRSSRSRSSTVSSRRNLYKTRVDYSNANIDDNDDGPMLKRKQYFNSASKIPNIGSLAYDL